GYCIAGLRYADDGLRSLVSGHTKAFDRPSGAAHKSSYRGDRVPNRDHSRVADCLTGRTIAAVDRDTERIDDWQSHVFLAEDFVRRTCPNNSGSDDSKHSEDPAHAGSHRPPLPGGGSSALWRILFEISVIRSEYRALGTFGDQL